MLERELDIVKRDRNALKSQNAQLLAALTGNKLSKLDD
jgi:hypothetical protein